MRVLPSRLASPGYVLTGGDLDATSTFYRVPITNLCNVFVPASQTCAS